MRILKGMKPVGLALEEIRELMELLDRDDRRNELDAETLRELADALPLRGADRQASRQAEAASRRGHQAP